MAYIPDRTTLTLPLVLTTDSTGEERPKVAESGRYELTGAKADIVAALMASGEPMASTAIAEAIGMGKTRTNELLGELIAEGIVVADGATRPRRYRTAR